MPKSQSTTCIWHSTFLNPRPLKIPCYRMTYSPLDSNENSFPWLGQFCWRAPTNWPALKNTSYNYTRIPFQVFESPLPSLCEPTQLPSTRITCNFIVNSNSVHPTKSRDRLLGGAPLSIFFHKRFRSLSISLLEDTHNPALRGCEMQVKILQRKPGVVLYSSMRDNLSIIQTLWVRTLFEAP